MLYAYPGLSDKQSGSFLTGCLFGIHMRRRLSWSHSWGALSSTQMWTQDMLHKYTEHYTEDYSQVRKCHKQKEFFFPLLVSGLLLEWSIFDTHHTWYFFTICVQTMLQLVNNPCTIVHCTTCLHHICDLVSNSVSPPYHQGPLLSAWSLDC